MADSRICTIPGCGKQLHARGRCDPHYRKLLDEKGRLRTDIRRTGLALTFADNAAISETVVCLVWPFQVNRDGYGSFRAGGRYHYAHRYVCIAAHGPANGKSALHRCGNPSCVNPKHLYWGDHRDNAEDARVHGTLARGERNAHALLSESQVKEILAAPEGTSYTTLATRYCVNRRTISMIRTGKRWSYLSAKVALPSALPNAE